MTERLYYHDSFLHEFPATVVEVLSGERPAIVLDRTAFYPTSGGQPSDTGTLFTDKGSARVAEVADHEGGRILHFIEGDTVATGTAVRGAIDVPRRRDHMQQHSGQHVLSAAFIQLFGYETVSFHMGDEFCSIDLAAGTLDAQQMAQAEKLANDVVLEDRPVDIRFVSRDEAQSLGLRKIPPAERDQLRLIDVRNFDLTACGGTHVARTGQIGAILLRKTEKVKPGWRVEFVCGNRAVASARRDFVTLTEAAALLSSHIWELPQQIRKLQETGKASRKSVADLQEELASYHANQLLAETPERNGRKMIARIFPDRDLDYVKLLAQRAVRQGTAICFFASTAAAPAIVFAQTAGQPHNMGALMKEALTALGGRGGGSKDMAQGGPERVESLESVLKGLASRVGE
jgi:alanyl-tRNA synthetase